MSKSPKYATIQIKQEIKAQVVEYCNKNGLKISKYVEMLFLHHVSGSTGNILFDKKTK